MPFGNDLLLIAFVSADRDGISWFPYVLASSIGSVSGVLLLDLLMRRTGEKGLERFVSRRKVENLKNKIENKARITLFVATLMPPSFPFTPVVMTASALQCPRPKLLGAVFLGRLIRFTVEAVLALYFGRRVIAYVNSDVFAYVVYGLIAIPVVSRLVSGFKWLRRK